MYILREEKVKSTKNESTNVRKNQSIDKGANGEKFILLGLYVDGNMYISNDDALRMKFEGSLKKMYKLKSTDQVTHFLGLDIEQSNNGDIQVNQKTFIQKILKLFEMDNAKTMNVPICEKVENVKKGNGAMLENKRLYQSIVGSLLYLSNGSRPDIAYAVGRLASKMSQPTKRNLTQAKGVLRYLKNSQDLGLIFKGKGARIL